jgi:thiamine-monophosphate kinase
MVMDEFDLIRKYFAPLATSPGAAGLQDDVAEIGTLDGGARLIATKDAISEGIHFLPSDPIDTVARKLVRVNVSDTIAKGARPDSALLALVWPKSRPADEIGIFAQALGDDLARWGAHLVGGDTTSTEGPLTLSLTMLGRCGPRGPVRRSGARPGEDIWVTGVIGDGWLGLQAVKGAFARLDAGARDVLVAKYRVPDLPPLTIANLVAEFASSSIDISDGLVADATHIAEASGVGMVIRGADVPLSDAGRSFLTNPKADLSALLTGGDDYQTLFTAPPEHRGAIRQSGLSLTCIGQVEAGADVRVLGSSGEPMALEKTGWAHFSR